MSGTSSGSTSSKPPTHSPPNPRSLAGRRISKYLAEPSTFGNTLVSLPYNTEDVTAAEAAHKRQILEDLAKLESRLPHT